MSVDTMSRVFWTDIPDLAYPDKKGKLVTVQASTCKIVLLAIADNANDYGENSWQSFDTLKTKTSLQKRSVIRAIRSLVENKYLMLDGISRFGTNNYTVNVAVLGQRPPRRGVFASDVESLAKPAKTPASDSGAVASDSGAPGSDGESPDPSLSIPKPPKEEDVEKEKILKDLTMVARSVFGNNITLWRNLSRELEKESVRIHREDGRLLIGGLGMQAAMFQDRYARSFSNCLTTEVIFEE